MAIYPAFYTRGAFIGGPTSNGTSGQTLITAGDGTSSWTNTLTAAATNTSALIAKALAGQSAVTFKVVSSDDSVHFSAGGTSVISNVNVDFASKLTVTPASVGQVVTTITGLSSQTATLLQLNHGATPGASANYLSCTSSGGSEGDVLAVLSSGRVTIAQTSASYRLDIGSTSGTVGVRVASNTANDILYYGTGTVTGSVFLYDTAINATTSVIGRLTNTNTANSTSNASLQMIVGGASAGDPYFYFGISGVQNWSVGVDNSDGDKLKIGPVSTPSTAGAAIVVDPSTNNVALGSTTASSKLRVVGTGSYAAAGISAFDVTTHTVTLSGADPTTYATMHATQLAVMTLVGTNANQTVTDAATLRITGPPAASTNVTLTRGYGMWSSGITRMDNVTAPATSPTNAFQFYSDDQAAGNAAPHFRTENGSIIKLYKTGTYTPTNVTVDRSYDADTVLVAELADVVGTLIADLQLTGLIG